MVHFKARIYDTSWDVTPNVLANTRVFAVSAIVILAPLASGLRGFSLEMGRGAMLAIDLLTLILFALCFLSPQGRTLAVCVAAMLLFGLFHAVFWKSPDLFIVYQGIRKSLFFLMAISIGLSLSRTHTDLVIRLILLSCLGIALYGIKQMFWYSDFDGRLLDAQAANFYSNRIWGLTRATSVLSSGFHLGMAGCIAIALALASKGLPATWRFASIAVALTGIYASYTRTFLLISAMLIAYHVLSRRVPLQFALGIVALAVLPLATILGLDLFSIIATALTNDDRVTNRLSSYLQFWSFMQQFPMGWITGFGPGSAGSTLEVWFRQMNVPWIEPHGILLKYPFEFGVPLALAIAWWAWRIVRARSDTPSFRSDASLYMALIVISAGLTVTSLETWPVNLFAGIVIGVLARRASGMAAHDA